MNVGIKNKTVDIKSNVLYFFIAVIMWIGIFDPPIISGFNIIHVIGLISILYLIAFRVNLGIKITKLYIFLLCVFLYLIIVLLINVKGGFFTNNIIYWTVDIIPFALALTHIFKKKETNAGKIISIIVWAGLIESALVVLSFLVPAIHDLFINLMIKAGYGADFLNTWSFRLYGFASNLQYSSGIALAVIALLALNEALIGRKKRYYVYSMVIFACGFINCRTTIIIYLLGIVLLAFVERKRIAKILLFLLVIVILITIVFFYGTFFSSAQASWLKDGLYDILSIFSDKYGAQYSAVSYFTSAEKYSLPNDFGSWIIGIGQYIMVENPYGSCTDIGFINDFWYGGIIYFCMTLFAYFWTLRQLYLPERKNNNRTFAIMLIFLCTMVIANIKGILFSFNNISTLIIIIIVFKMELLFSNNSVSGEEKTV